MTVVCEASSFQLEDTLAFSPEAAVLLNLSPDHLDRHGDVRGLRRRQAADLRQPGQLRRRGRARRSRHRGHRRLRAPRPVRRPAPARSSPSAPAICGGMSSRSSASRRSRFPERTTSRTRWRPPRCASRAASTPTPSRPGCGRSPACATASSGSPYRTASRGSTTRRRPTSPARSWRCGAFAAPIHLIAGGRGKQQDFSPLAPLVAERCRAVYLIGEAAGELGGGARVDRRPASPGGRSGTRRDAGARRRRARGDVVLLSPACASYDQYPDFEARGDHFRALVEGA